MLDRGYLAALVEDMSSVPDYWAGILRDYPNHPVKDKDATLRHSLGCIIDKILSIRQLFRRKK